MAKKPERKVSPILGIASEIHVFEARPSQWDKSREVQVCQRCGFETTTPNDTTTIACTNQQPVEGPDSEIAHKGLEHDGF